MKGGYTAMKSIGLIMSTLDTAATLNLYRGISDTAKKLGFSTWSFLIYPTVGVSNYFFDGEFHIFHTIDFDDFDAYIVSINTIRSESVKKKMLAFLQTTGKPVIAIDCNIPQAYSISTSNYEASRLLVEHLLHKHGVQKINYISGPENNEEALDRMQAYIDAMTEHGIFDEERIFHGSFTVNDGENALLAFEANEKAKDYDAIVCANDMSAISLYEALEHRGKKIPSDVLVTGFDDIEEARLFYPELTTALKPSYQTGISAVSLLHRIMNGQPAPKTSTIATEVIYRGSCGCEPDRKDAKDCQNAQLNFFTERKTTLLQAKTCIENLMDCNCFSEYIEYIKGFIRQVDPPVFYFFLYARHEQALGLKNYAHYESSILEDDGKIILPFYYKDGIFYENKKPDLPRLDIKTISQEGYQYVCSPIHFRDVDYGFIVFANSIYPFWEESYREWLEGLNTTLNSLHDRLLLQAAVEKLNDLYMRDSLTGLYNRFGLLHFWQIYSKRCTTKQQPLLFLFIDINGLKKINDTFGHEDGDFTICTVAEAIKSIGSSVTAIRYGGDEFIILCEDAAEERGNELLARFHQSLSELNQESPKPYRISASTGLFVKTPDCSFGLNDCIRMADEQMYKSKKQKS